MSPSARQAFHLSEMTFEEADAAFRDCDTAIVVTGATEQHGPHCGMGLDYLVADRVARMVAERVKCIVGPALPIGFSRQWMNFRGTMTLRRETFQALVEDVVGSMIWHGANRVLILNGHGRNAAVLNDVCLKIRYATGAIVTHLEWFKPLHGYGTELGVSTAPGDRPFAHASEVETSALLAVEEDFVHMDRAIRPKLPDELFRGVPEISISGTETPVTVGFKPFRGYSPSLGLDGTEHTDRGVVGSALGATADKGRKMLSLAADLIADYVRTIQRINVTVHTRPRFY